VRSRDEALGQAPADSIGPQKRRAIARAARAYRAGLRSREIAWRFDIVEVTWRRDGTAFVRHLPETPVFHPDYRPGHLLVSLCRRAGRV
jgi:Holliday junction resolvase-like predicted endonuclease